MFNTSTLILSDALFEILPGCSFSPRTIGSMVIMAQLPPEPCLQRVPGLTQTHPSIFLANKTKSLGVMRMSGLISGNMSLSCISHSMGVICPPGQSGQNDLCLSSYSRAWSIFGLFYPCPNPGGFFVNILTHMSLTTSVFTNPTVMSFNLRNAGLVDKSGILLYFLI